MTNISFSRSRRRRFTDYYSYGRLGSRNIRNELKKYNLSLKEVNSVMNGQMAFMGKYLNFPFEVGDLIYNTKSPKIRLLIQKVPSRKFSSIRGSYHASWNIQIVNFRNGTLKLTNQ